MTNSVFAADLYYHKSCMSAYLLRYQRCNAEKTSHCDESSPLPLSEVFFSVLKEIQPNLYKGMGYSLSDIRDRINAKTESQRATNRDIKQFLMDFFQDEVTFSTPKEANKSVLFF